MAPFVKCRHPKAGWSLRSRTLRGKKVLVATCGRCGETQVNPADAATFGSRTKLTVAAGRE